MAIPNSHNSESLYATAWMPLDGLMQQWSQFGSEAASVPALHATGAVFSAFACETEAREYYMAAMHTSRKADLTDLETALD